MKLFTLSAALLLSVPLLAQRASVGDQLPDFSFGKFLDGDGRQRLADFYGFPVMIDFWGIN